jgi:hypothetical protein
MVGADRLDREVDEADELLVSKRSDDGLRYLGVEAVTPLESLLPEDHAVTSSTPVFKSTRGPFWRGATKVRSV